jgi:hypothetical protein
MTRFGYGRISRIRRRTQTEYLDAIRTREPGTVLIAGNSLLKDGVDVERLGEQLGASIKPRRFVVENTNYTDWYYGLRHLFSRGSRPETVLLIMSPRQWVSPAFHGDEIGGLMLNRSDVRRVAADVGIDNTKAANLMFATFSNFYANRAQLRKWLLGRLVPGLESFSIRLVPNHSAPPLNEALERTSLERLRAMRELCGQYGARLIVAIPPTNAEPREVAAVAGAGGAADVAVLVPVQEGRLPADYFSDGFHLNERGRSIFTDALALRMRHTLSAPARDPG